MTTLNSRLQLSILNRKKSKSLAEKGFTLIELLITVVILGTLSAIALPSFLKYQNQAIAGQNNAEASAKARDCAATMATPNPTYVEPCTAEGGVFEVDNDANKASAATASVDDDGVVTLTASEAV